jgi:polysaccharide deacetylase family protein (PEP-CTERM system associated)
MAVTNPSESLFFSVDVEEWTSDFPSGVKRESRVREPLERLLQLLQDSHSKATFFYLTEVAEHHPDLLRRVVSAGHRIGLHGLDHRLVYRQSPEEFGRCIERGRKTLEDLAGARVSTYRAPCWSLTRASLWAARSLVNAGFQVDSSIYPTRNHLYGIPDAPAEPYLLADGLVEFPPPCLRVLGLNLPFGGGFYLRAAPRWLTGLLLDWAQRRGQRPVLYAHPWELDVSQPRDLPYGSAIGRLIHYFNLGTTDAKLAWLMTQFGPFQALPSLRYVAHRCRG